MIGVAVSCYVGHLPLLLELFDSIENQTRLPDKVVVSSSSTRPEDEIKNMKQYSFEYEIIYTPEHKNAAANRNIAIDRLLDMEYVTFIDADDVMHPQRIELIMRTIDETYGDLIVHGYTYEKDFKPIEKLEYKVNHLFPCISGCLTSNFNYRFHHAHSTVRRYILEFVRFSEDPSNNRKEDCVFCRQVYELRNVVNVCIINELSWYRPSGTIF